MSFPQEVKLLAIRYNILKFKDFTCEYCFKVVLPEDIHFDHIVPKSREGLDTLENCAVACSKCNMKKTKWSLEEFSKILSRRLVNCNNCIEFRENAIHCHKTAEIISTSIKCKFYVVRMDDKTCSLT